MLRELVVDVVELGVADVVETHRAVSLAPGLRNLSSKMNMSTVFLNFVNPKRFDQISGTTITHVTRCRAGYLSRDFLSKVVRPSVIERCLSRGLLTEIARPSMKYIDSTAGAVVRCMA